MKKFGKFFVYAAILLVLVMGGCNIPVDVPVEDAAVDPTSAPPPAGKVWVKIPLPDDSARTLGGTANSIFINYYEVYFLRRAVVADGVQEYLFSGTAKKGEQLVVSVVPDITYDVLLLAGDRTTMTLLASAYDTFSIVSGQINQVDLALDYIESDPNTSASSHVKFTYTDKDVFEYDGVSAAGKYYEATTVAVNSGTENINYAVGDQLLVGASSNCIIVRVTKVDSNNSNAVETVAVEHKGRFASEDSVTAPVLKRITGTGTGATFTFVPTRGTDIPENVPWLTYLGNRTNDLKFQIKTGNLGNLIAAGDTDAAGFGNFKLAKAKLVLDPLDQSVYKNFDPFTAVIDATTYNDLFTPDDDDGTDLDANSTGIAVTYTLDRTVLPEKQNTPDTYGMLYYELNYYAFTTKGSRWIIRNGIDINAVDKGARTRGAGVLVKIGNPGPFVSTVPVQIGTNN
jgi:hypothetical protein